MRNADCMIHLDLCYAYNNFECLLLAYKMILSLRQASHRMDLFCLFAILKLREHQCSQDSVMFLGSKETEYLSVFVDNGTLI